MAQYTTINEGVNNSIALASRYLPILDEVYKDASKTAILDAIEGERVRFIGAKTVNLFSTSMNGLGNYSRNQGFVTGDVTGTWEQYQLSQDRGRSFMVDVMDNDESMGMAFGTLAGEFIRTKEVPELDAYRFAKYASTSGVTVATPVDITGSVDGVALLDTADQEMSDDEVPKDGRIMFVSEKFYKNIKEHITRFVANSDNGINRTIEMFDNMPVVRVPKGRFYTKITLNDGLTGGQTAGGYSVPTDGTAYEINFMIVHPSAIMQVTKHVVPRIFSPEVNQVADAWKFDYRVYHDCFVEANKLAGVYVNHAATAVNP